MISIYRDLTNIRLDLIDYLIVGSFQNQNPPNLFKECRCALIFNSKSIQSDQTDYKDDNIV